MSLASLCQKHRVIPEKETDVRGTAGGPNVAYSADIPVPRTLSCFVQAMRAQELLKYKQTDYAIYHTVFFASDPKLDRSYRLNFNGRYLYIIDIYNDCELNKLWVAQCGERTQGPGA